MTDHSVQNNHLIDWERATVEDKVNQPVRQEKDAIAIRRKHRMAHFITDCPTYIYDRVFVDSTNTDGQDRREPNIAVKILTETSTVVEIIKVNKHFVVKKDISNHNRNE